MYCIFRNNAIGNKVCYCDFDNIGHYPPNDLLRDFRDECWIAIRGDEIIDNFFSAQDWCALDEFGLGLKHISAILSEEYSAKCAEPLSLVFTLDESRHYKLVDNAGRLTLFPHSQGCTIDGRKTFNRHYFVVVIKIILSEIRIFLAKCNNRFHQHQFKSGFDYIQSY